MAKRNRRIPFSWWPANWGMEGKRRAIAEAEYYWDGEDLARRLLDIEHDDHDSVEYKRANLVLDLQYKRITEREFKKEASTLNGDSYFEVLSADFRPTAHGASLSFELDWNEKFVEELIAEGWQGVSDDDVVNKWFEDTCKYMFAEDLMEDVPDYAAAVGATRTRRNPTDDNKAEYS